MESVDFKASVVDNCKTYLSENLDNSEIFENVIDCSCLALDGILTPCFNFAAIQRVLTYYLINAKECNEAKNLNAESINAFITVAQAIENDRIQLSILYKALFNMQKCNAMNKPCVAISVKKPDTQTV